jgi:hypothetical protein
MRKILLLFLIALVVCAWPFNGKLSRATLEPQSTTATLPALSLTSTPNIDIAGENSPDRQRVEPTIAVDPRNPSIIVAGAQDLRLKAIGEHRWHGYYRSTDGGETWSSGLLPGFPGDTSLQGTSSPLHVYNTTSDTVMAFDRSGNLYYAGIAFELNCTPTATTTCYPEVAFVAKYTNDGSAYAGTKLINGFYPADKPWIAVDTTGGPTDGIVYLSFDANILLPSGLVFTSVFTRSTDGGTTFSTPIAAPMPPNYGNLPGVAVDSAGNVYVSTLAVDVLGNPLNYIQVSKLTNGGSILTGTVVAAASIVLLPSPLPGGSFRTFTIPQIAADSSGVYLVWDDFRTGNANVMLSRSTDGGTTWSSPITVNDVTTGQHFFSTIIASGGIVSVAWYDSRFNTGTTLTVLDVFLAQSTNGALSFSPSTRVTNQSFNPETVLRTDGPNINEHFIGDYIDIGAYKGVVYPIWSDNRNACDTIDPVFGCVDQDVYIVPERIPLGVSFVSTLDSSSVTVNGSLLVDRLVQRTFANLTVTAVNTVSGAVTFHKTYSIGNLTMSALQTSSFRTRFLLNVAVLPYALSWDLTVDLQTLTGSANILLTRELDINGDGVVDFLDLSTAAFAYGSTTGTTNYNPQADFDADGSVSFIDISTAAFYYSATAFH